MSKAKGSSKLTLPRFSMKLIATVFLAGILQACATPVTAYNSESEGALIIHWANKHDFVFVRVDLDEGTASQDGRFVLRNRNSPSKLAFKGGAEDRAIAKRMLDEGWDGRDTIDYATATIAPGTYALVHSAYWFDPGTGYMGISSAHYEAFHCLTDRAAVFAFKSGKINALENWAHLHKRISSETGSNGPLTQQNEAMIRLMIKEYPDLNADVQTAPIVAFVKFQRASTAPNRCAASASFEVLERVNPQETSN